MGADTRHELVAHVADLDRRDDAVARELESVTSLLERSEAARAHGAELRAALARIPGELQELAARGVEARADEDRAREEAEAAAARVARLESGRRRREEELDRARSELATAQVALADARTRLARLDEHEAGLRVEGERLAGETDELVAAARTIADGLGGVQGLATGARRDPGGTLDELEEWAAGARSALFVLRGTLELQRERIVLEANALGSAVLGEPLGGSSVSLVRRRVEEALAAR